MIADRLLFAQWCVNARTAIDGHLFGERAIIDDDELPGRCVRCQLDEAGARQIRRWFLGADASGQNG